MTDYVFLFQNRKYLPQIGKLFFLDSSYLPGSELIVEKGKKSYQNLLLGGTYFQDFLVNCLMYFCDFFTGKSFSEALF